ncbi:unnamed protein product [Cuscuta epithymum]|uniref:Uncharacterized protein n=1 Tax=Cuscuta epithymum TaxID=186058 RepID=A0AAV0FDS5_9ASTE|nr:unnamed protein product [Cuscuta epithymum]
MTIKRQTCNIFVCLMVVVIDITAGILGIEAEVAQSKVSLLKVWIFECRYPSYEAFKLGLAATALLVLAHAISNLLGGCGFCIRSKEELHKSSSNKQLAFASLIIQCTLNLKSGGAFESSTGLSSVCFMFAVGAQLVLIVHRRCLFFV